MAQQLVERRGIDKQDVARTGRMALYGGGTVAMTLAYSRLTRIANTMSAAVFGPGATLWYGFLQRKIRIPSSPNLEILARVGVDQTVFASTNLFLFLSSMAIMEGSDPKKKLEQSYTTALAKNWMVWPVVQATNFKFVPLEHRVLVVNVVSLGKSLENRVVLMVC